ncbi:cell division protein FtsB [Castellaniella sp.]|uniref:cell division protein FtsB n=1 Tax=Castellaniella sp. TaxID=1955812 RepID=UPI003566D175
MRLLCLILLLLLLVIQYPLWWGKGGWLDLRDLQARLAAQTETNEALQARNNALRAEVNDLADGTSAIEERARGELNMVRPGEYYVQIVPAPPPPAR